VSRLWFGRWGWSLFCLAVAVGLGTAQRCEASELCWLQPFVENSADVAYYEVRVAGVLVSVEPEPGGWIVLDGVAGVHWCAESEAAGTFEWSLWAVGAFGRIAASNNPQTRYASIVRRADINGNGGVDLGDVSSVLRLLGQADRPP